MQVFPNFNILSFVILARICSMKEGGPREPCGCGRPLPAFPQPLAYIFKSIKIPRAAIIEYHRLSGLNN